MEWDLIFKRLFPLLDLKKGLTFSNAFSPLTRIKEIAPMPLGEDIATISSLKSIYFSFFVNVALLLCSVL